MTMEGKDERIRKLMRMGLRMEYATWRMNLLQDKCWEAAT